MNPWWRYVMRVAGTDVQKDIAKTGKVDHATVNRWANGAAPSFGSVVSFARAYHRPVVEALVASGLLSESDVGNAIEVVEDPARWGDETLIAELAQRLRMAREGSPHQSESDTIAGLGRRFGPGEVQGGDEHGQETG